LTKGEETKKVKDLRLRFRLSIKESSQGEGRKHHDEIGESRFLPSMGEKEPTWDNC